MKKILQDGVQVRPGNRETVFFKQPREICHGWYANQGLDLPWTCPEETCKRTFTMEDFYIVKKGRLLQKLEQQEVSQGLRR